MSLLTPQSISPATRVLAIIGDPIEHSLTPRIQNAALRDAGLDLLNVAFRVPPARLAQAVQGARDLGLLGLMVTIPHKEKVLDLCDSLHESARLMGAANLLEFTTDGLIVGHSSDGWAALRSLDEEGVCYAGKNVVILGGGGAARSLALTFAHAGVARIALLNRTLSRADAIAAEVIAQGVPAITGIPEGQDMRQIMEDCELLVNATSVGMTPEVDRTPVAREFLRPGLAVYDIVYNPLETRLLREARQAGARPVDGLGMLIYTNVYAVQTCAAGTISASVMRQEALKALAERSH